VNSFPDAAAPAAGPHAWTSVIDRWIGVITEPLAAVLLVVEVVILAAGVFSRYVLHNAIVWTDEVATILLLWLAMLGAVSAYRRREHIRLTAVVRRVSPATAELLDIISSVVVVLFVVVLAPAFRTFLIQEQTDLTPVLGVPKSDVIASIAVALALMFVISIVRLIEAPRKQVGIVVGIGLLVVIAAFAGRPLLMSLGNINLLLFFVLLVGACVAIGVPIAFAFGFGTLTYLALTTTVPLSTLVDRMDEGISSLILLAIPLFIVLGLLMGSAGIAKRLVNALASVVGHLRGGLGIVLVFAMYLVSGISGSKAADMAAVAPVLFPEMERRGTPRPELVALLASSAAMAETIPPSLVLIIIGSTTGVSIAALFAAGLVPAALAAVFLLVVVYVRSRNDRTELAQRPALREILWAFFVAIPGFVLPFLIRAAILGGVATATEVSTIGIVYTILVGIFVYREFDWRKMYPLLRETASLTGAIMLIIATATAMAWALTQSGFADQLATMLSNAPGGKLGFMAMAIVLFLVLGSILEGIPAIVLFGPLLFPIAKAAGISDVHFAIVAVLAMGIGLFAPPFGAGFYAACAIGKCDSDLAAPRIVPYLLAIVLALIFVAAIPQLSLGFGPQLPP
jgi:tripartite ATP-independent transporter DctM subunit